MLIVDYRAKVQAEVDDASSSASTVIDRAIKATYQEIIKRVGQYLLGSTTGTATAVAGTADYTPTSFMFLKDVQYAKAGSSDYTQLKEISMDEYLANHVNDSTGTPMYYVVNGLQIKLSPTPNDAGTIRYEYVPVKNELSGTEVSAVPDRYENAVIMGACYRFFAYDDNPKATEYFQWYQLDLKNMVDELSADTITKPKLFGR
jgi:hypothetical protein